MRGRRALVVDDNDVARTVMLAMTQEAGLDSVGASSGSAAVQAVERAAAEGRPFDIVYMDWQMPGMDGIEAAASIHELGLSQAPLVLMVTAYDRQEVIREGGQEVASDILLKPVSAAALVQSTAAALDPQGRASSPEAASPSREQEKAMRSLKGRHVLLVEDNEINQIVAQEILAEVGMTCGTAANGLAALQMLEDERYDIVLMDMQMPVMGGLEATQESRKQSRFAALPIIALTANAMDTDRERCLEAGMNGYVSKPLDPQVLWSVMEQCLQGKLQAA